MSELEALAKELKKDARLRNVVFARVHGELYPRNTKESARFHFESDIGKPSDAQKRILKEYVQVRQAERSYGCVLYAGLAAIAAGAGLFFAPFEPEDVRRIGSVALASGGIVSAVYAGIRKKELVEPARAGRGYEFWGS
ncbi:hypothetical protein C4580_03505 [Candidatus Woesearchaeota archaeon]|nr:MAG: hypothetical protein C4580_03505 [Candidatus Woesearchaeota archaeon]